MKSQFLGRNDKENRYRYRKYQETQPEVCAKVSMGPKHPFCTQAPHLRVSNSCFRSNFHEPAANRLLQNVRYHCIMHLHHAYHASYCIILDHIGSYWITGKLLSTLLVCRRRTREGCTQHKSHRTSRLWNQSEPVSRILQEHWPKHRVGP